VCGAVLRVTLAVALGGVVFGAAARAQGPVDAAVRGRVLEAGAAVSGAVVQVTPLGADPAASEQTVQTGRDGAFLLDRLTPGIYRIRAIASDGLMTETTLVLDAGQLVEPTLSLDAGQSQLDAQMEAALVAAAENEPSATELLLQTLPVSDRQVLGLTQLDSEETAPALPAAGADPDTAASETQPRLDGSPAARTQPSYGGLPAIENSLTFDGLSANQSFRGGPRGASQGGASAAATFGQSAIRQLRVLPQTFSARYGGAAGGVLALNGRQPAAHLHGTVFVQERPSLFAATNPFSIETHYRDGVITTGTVKPAGFLTLFGGQIGGPLTGHWLPVKLKERIGLLGSVELQLRDDQIVSSPAVASFYALSGDQIALLGVRGVTHAATNTALDYLDSLSGETARHAWRLQAFSRIDARVSDRDEVTLGYNGEHFDAPAGAAPGQASEAVVARGTGSLGSSFVSIDAVTGRWLHRISPRWNSELRGQIAHDLEYETPHAPLAQEPGIGPGGYAPQVSIAPDGFAYGTPSNLGRVAYPDELRVQLVDDMQLRLGHHLITLGADWSRIHDRIASITAAEGAFSYDSGTTNGYDGGLVDWITDYTYNVNAYPNGACPSIANALNGATHYFCFRSYTQGFGPLSTSFTTHELAGYLEDAWRLRDDLNLTAGARYDYTLLPLPQAPNYTLDTALAALTLPVSGVTETFPEDRNNIAPRVGLAWSPARRGRPILTAHLGYGWFYGRIPGATVRSAITDTALAESTLHVRIRPTTITNCPQVSANNQGFGYPCAFTSQPTSAVAVTSSATLFARHYQDPAVQRATLSLERTFASRLDLRLSYVLALATELPSSVDINIAPATGYAQYILQGGDGHPGLATGQQFSVPLYTQRRLTAYGPMTALVSNANATYHAATIEAHTRPIRSLELRGSYTFSRSIDYAPQAGATPALNNQLDPFHHGYDRGLSSQQVPQRFTGDLVWEPSVRRGRALLLSTLNHWHIAALATAGSGAPYSYEIFGGTYLSGGRDSINGAGGLTYLPTVGRNTLRLPAHGRIDGRLTRDFNLNARVHAQFSAQAFNLLNTQTITSVQTRAFLPGTPTPNVTPPTPLVFQDAAELAVEGLTTTVPFGQPRSTSNGFNHERQIELGLRVRF
jgi:hypothetical protein